MDVIPTAAGETTEEGSGMLSRTTGAEFEGKNEKKAKKMHAREAKEGKQKKILNSILLFLLSLLFYFIVRLLSFFSSAECLKVRGTNKSSTGTAKRSVAKPER